MSGIGQQAQVLGAFVQAFGRTLFAQGRRPGTPLARPGDLPPGESRLWARRASLELEPGLTLLIDELFATLTVSEPGAPLRPEHRGGFRFGLHAGRIALDADSIKTLLTRYALPAGAALSGVGVSLSAERLVLTGKLRLNPLLSLAVELGLAVSARPDGALALAVMHFKASGWQLDRLLRALKIPLGSLMPASTGGLRFEGEQFVLDPLAVLPEPVTTGTLVSASVQGGHLVMSYDDGEAAHEAPLLEPTEGPHVLLYGHRLAVGKVQVQDAWVQLLPSEAEAEAVHFSLPHHRRQLSAGESRLLANDGLLYRIAPVGAEGAP